MLDLFWKFIQVVKKKNCLFVCSPNLHNFDLYVFPISFEDEIYLISLTLELLCCALCRCQVRVVVVGARAGLIALRRARLCFTSLRVLLIPMTSRMPWRMYVLVLMHYCQEPAGRA